MQKKQIEAFQSEKGSYPTANNCVNSGQTEICLKSSNGNTLNYSPNSYSNPTSYTLVVSKGTTSYQLSNSSSSTSCGGTTIPNIVTSGLILNLDAGITTSYPGTGTTWTDISGNGNNGTISGGPAYVCANEGAIYFNSAGTVIVPNHPGLNNTVSIWVKPANSTNMDIFGDELSFTGSGLQLFNGKYMIIASGSPSTAYRYSVNATPNYSTFDNIVISYGAGNVVTYKNAVADSVISTQTLYPGAYRNFTLGDSSSGGYNMTNFNGYIAQYAVYNRVLSQAEITQNFNALKSRFGL